MIELVTESLSLGVDEAAGARLASLVVDGAERLVTLDAGGPDSMQWGAYPMAPYAGRVRHGRFEHLGERYELPITLGSHAIHGTVYNRAWEVVSSSPSGVTLATELGPDWPWQGWVTHTVAVDAGSLVCTLSLHTLEVPFPGMVGWHPWFSDGGRPPRLSADVGRMYRRDDDYMATADLGAPGPHPWDDCFTDVAQPVTLTYGDGVALDVTSDCDHWVIYEPDRAVCVEPQSGPPDAFTLAPQLITPDAPLVRWMRIARR